jgi:hypothetical protein
LRPLRVAEISSWGRESWVSGSVVVIDRWVVSGKDGLPILLVQGRFRIIEQGCATRGEASCSAGARPYRFHLCHRFRLVPSSETALLPEPLALFFVQASQPLVTAQLKLVRGLLPLVQSALSGRPKGLVGLPDLPSSTFPVSPTVSGVAESHSARASRTDSARRSTFNASVAALPSEAHGLIKVTPCGPEPLQMPFALPSRIGSNDHVSIFSAFGARQEAERMFLDLSANYEIACMEEIGVDSVSLNSPSVRRHMNLFRFVGSAFF